MRHRLLLAACAALLATASTASAAQLSGEYLEARTCNVFIGPCFANGEMNLDGKEAIMAWKVDRGSWEGVPLDGLGAALVVAAENTLGYDGVFAMKAGATKSIVLVDERASETQRDALVRFVKESAKSLTEHVVGVIPVPFELKNDHLAGHGLFSAGKIAKIETREVRDSDCVCSNEIVYYLPLADVENFSPAFSTANSYQGKHLDSRWQMQGQANAFLATFRR
jgi:hypothetical protein